ncbi:MAG: MBL fold metallo-hydrolase [Sphingorhabdus sp.]
MAEKKKSRFSWLWKMLLVLLLALVAATYWFFYDNRAPSEGSFALDIAAIRAEADHIPGEKPSQIEVETPWHNRVPEIAMLAGAGWGNIDLSGASYRLVLPGGAIIIDAAFDPESAKKMGISDFDDAAWKRLLRAMDEAAQIVITHEHSDHIGGLMTNANVKALVAKTRLNAAQIALPNYTNKMSWPSGALDRFKPTVYDSLLAIAPGVVLIKAKGHTPGSQMIYVQRADGQEYLFMGDVASLADNVKQQRIRSRLITDLMTFEDRDAVFLQTKALLKLSQDQPDIVMVPGHDTAAVEAFVKSGLITRGFGE